MTVHQCPRCELRFALRGDLEDHLRLDHQPVVAATPPPPPARGRIVVPLDPIKPRSRAVDFAVALAGEDTVVELVSVRTPGLPDSAIDAFLAAERRRCRGARTEVVRLGGESVADALLDHLVRSDPDLVVLESHGRSPLGELVLGSVSADLVRASSAPTMLVGPGCAPVVELRRFTVAVDGSPDSLGALDVGAALARRFGIHLELVEVAEEHAYASDGAESAQLHRLAERVDPPVRDWDVLHGHDVSRALIDHVRREPGAVLVVGSHGRSAWRRDVLGGTASRVVRHATVPVLVVTPQVTSAVEPRGLAGTSQS